MVVVGNLLGGASLVVGQFLEEDFIEHATEGVDVGFERVVAGLEDFGGDPTSGGGSRRHTIRSYHTKSVCWWFYEDTVG